MTRSRLAFVASVLALSACSPSGTYVVMSFTTGPTTASTIHCNFTLGGKAATTDFVAKSGTFTFPTKGSVEVGNGSGALSIVCEARDAAGTVLASASASANVVRDTTTNVDIPFGPVQGDDGGIRPTGALTIAPLTHNFGVTLVGAMSPPQTFVVTNTGEVPTGKLEVLLMSDAGMDYAITNGNCAQKALAAKDTCTLDVVFAPKTAGLTKHALVQVTAPDGSPGGTATASVDGSAGAKGDLHFDKDTANFGGITVGKTSTDTTFTLTNTGTGPSSQIAVALSGSNAASFTKTADGCDGTVLPGGGTCTVKVVFAPAARGDLSASLSASANKGGTAVSNLTGKGQVAAQLTIMGAAPASAPANLGTVDVGATGTLAHHFTVRNDGDFAAGPLTIDTVPLSADVTPTVLTTCAAGMVLNPGDSCVGDLVLKPTSFGIKNVQINFGANPGGTVTTFVTGVGQDHITIQAAFAGMNGATGVVNDSAIPMNFNCGAGNTICTKTFTRNTTIPMITLVANPDAVSVLDQWTTAPSAAPPCTEGTPDKMTTCSLMLGAGVPANTSQTPFVYTANFLKKNFSVTYQRMDADYLPATFGGDGGGLGALVSSNGYNCPKGPCSTVTELVPAGTSLTVTAKARTVAGAGSTVRRITAPACTSGTSYAAGATDATCTFTVNANVTVTAKFSAHNYAFVTSTAYDGNLGGLAGADAKCAAAATAAKIPGTFISVLSNSTTNARDRIANTANGWIRIDSLPWAQDKTSLFAQGSGGAAVNNYKIYYPLSMDENGANNPNGQLARTYTQADGTKNGTTLNCLDWTSSTDPSTTSQTMGIISTGSVAWTNGSGVGAGCALPGRLYCVGTDLNTPVLNIPVPQGSIKRLFRSTGKFTPANGLMRKDMDDVCAAEGNGAMPGATGWKALVATTASTAASQAPAGTYVIMRPDRVVVGMSTAVLGNLGPLSAPINVFANSTYPSSVDAQGWSGSPAPNVNGSISDTCNNWGDPTGVNGRIGFTFETSGQWWNWVTQPCSGARNFACIEQ